MADKRLLGKNVLMVIAPEEFRDEELSEPKDILSRRGANVTVASTAAGQARGMLGATVTPDATIDKVQASDYHAIVVVGGMGSPQHLWNNDKLKALLKQAHESGKVVAGICLSGAVLANAGVLSGKKATVWACDESLQALKDGKAIYTKQPVVAEGNIITAEGPDAASEFGNAIATALEKAALKV
jgi:protease I